VIFDSECTRNRLSAMLHPDSPRELTTLPRTPNWIGEGLPGRAEGEEEGKGSRGSRAENRTRDRKTRKGKEKNGRRRTERVDREEEEGGKRRGKEG